MLILQDRDDELASEMPIQDAEEKDEDPESPYKAAGLQIELAVSETKPFTRSVTTMISSENEIQGEAGSKRFESG